MPATSTITIIDLNKQKRPVQITPRTSVQQVKEGFRYGSKVFLYHGKTKRILKDNQRILDLIPSGENSDFEFRMEGALLSIYRSITGYLRGEMEEKRNLEVLFNQLHPAGVSRDDFIRKYAAIRDIDIITSGHLFDLFDMDENGTIDFREWHFAMCVLSGDSWSRKLRSIFDFYDANGDGHISRVEFYHIAGRMYRFYNQTSNLAYRPRGQSTAKLLVDSIFDKYDLNHDNKLNFKEFTFGYEEDPDMLRWIINF